jgi:hypothetical protein
MHFIKQPNWIYYEGQTIFSVQCGANHLLLSLSPFFNTLPLYFFTSLSPDRRQGLLAICFNFHFFLSPKKKVLFSKCWSDSFFVKNALVFWYTFFDPWLCFLISKIGVHKELILINLEPFKDLRSTWLSSILKCGRFQVRFLDREFFRTFLLFFYSQLKFLRKIVVDDRKNISLSYENLEMCWEWCAC